MGASTQFRSYWDAYGGFSAVMRSRYFWLAVVLTAATYPWWVNKPWWERVLAIEPTMLGFSLGGYVVLLGVGSEKFMELLARAGRENGSAFVGVSSAFVHFIIVQFVSLISALLFVATEETFWSTPGWKNCGCLYTVRIAQQSVTLLLFYYSLTTGIAATLRIFSLSNLYVAMVRTSPPDRGEEKSSPLYVTVVAEQSDEHRKKDT